MQAANQLRVFLGHFLNRRHHPCANVALAKLLGCDRTKAWPNNKWLTTTILLVPVVLMRPAYQVARCSSLQIDLGARSLASLQTASLSHQHCQCCCSLTPVASSVSALRWPTENTYGCKESVASNLAGGAESGFARSLNFPSLETERKANTRDPSSVEPQQ